MEAASMDTKRQNSRARTNRKILMEKLAVITIGAMAALGLQLLLAEK